MGAFKDLSIDTDEPELWTLRTVLAAIACAETQSEYDDLLRTRDEILGQLTDDTDKE
jgi:hypothetical protein